MMNETIHTQMIVVLICIMSLMPFTDYVVSSENNKTLIVAKSSDTDFSSISSAVREASEGDCILIKSGVYRENIVIDKKIHLIGQNPQNTIIDANNTGDCIYVDEDGITISNLTLQHSGPSGRDCGIELHGNFSTISNVKISECTIGIYARESHNNSFIKNNLISNKDYGIHLHTSSDNYISMNAFFNNRWGIFIYRSSNNNLISQNDIDQSSYHGIWASWCQDNIIKKNVIFDSKANGIFLSGISDGVIQRNHLEENNQGMFFSRCNNVLITENNFIDNQQDASYMGGSLKWRHNYWNRFRLAPKLIQDITPSVIPSFTFDLRPAFKPFDIQKSFLVNDLESRSKKPTSQKENLPDSYDYRNIDGTDYTTPVKNQIPAPTCEAYALCASLETSMQYMTNELYEPDLSETHLYFYAGGTYEAGGVLLGDAAEYLVTTGVPDEGCFPDPHRNFDYDFESLAGWEKRTVQITEWGWVDFEEKAMKQALIDYGPLIICVMQRPDFLSYRRGVYNPFRFLPMVSGHVITIVGYDDTDKCWIVKNSAGSDWGENGYVRISYDAHTQKTPIFYPFYGGTGVLYIDGIFGNLKPSTPKIYIDNLQRHHTYLFGFSFPTQLKDLEGVKNAIPRIINWATVKTSVEDVDGVRFYLDGKLMNIDENAPFTWKAQASTGVHTIEAIAFNKQGMSKDIRDVYFF